jgi:hypothetical protein
MTDYPITRTKLLAALVDALEPLGYVQAFWESGAIAFDRLDEWSDADIQMVVEDERVEDAFEAIEETLNTLSEIDLKFRLPEPTWHGHSQCFYTLKDASPFLMLDLVILKASADFSEFLTAQVHGQPHVFFDKAGVVDVKLVDFDDHFEKIKNRLEQIKQVFPIFQVLTIKEINRGNGIEAISFYMSYTLRPLVEVLRIKHCPIRFSYSTRYTHYDLPPDVVTRLQRLYFAKDVEDLRTKHTEAGDWFWEVAENIDLEEVKKKIG